MSEPCENSGGQLNLGREFTDNEVTVLPLDPPDENAIIPLEVCETVGDTSEAESEQQPEKRIKFDKNQNSELISAVKAHPDLYESPRSKTKRQAAFKVLAEIFHLSVADVKYLWKMLRDGYSRYLKDARRGEPAARKYEYAEQLAFLEPYIKTKNIDKNDKTLCNETSDSALPSNETLTSDNSSLNDTSFEGSPLQGLKPTNSGDKASGQSVSSIPSSASVPRTEDEILSSNSSSEFSASRKRPASPNEPSHSKRRSSGPTTKDKLDDLTSAVTEQSALSNTSVNSPSLQLSQPVPGEDSLVKSKLVAGETFPFSLKGGTAVLQVDTVSNSSTPALMVEEPPVIDVCASCGQPVQATAGEPETKTDGRARMKTVWGKILQLVHLALPEYVMEILTASGFTTITTISSITESQLTEAENFVRRNGIMAKLIPANEKELFFYWFDEKNYTILPAHRNLVLQLAEKLKLHQESCSTVATVELKAVIG